MFTLGFNARADMNSIMAPVFSRASSRSSATFLGFRGRPFLFGLSMPLTHLRAGLFVFLSVCVSSARSIASTLPISSFFIWVPIGKLDHLDDLVLVVADGDAALRRYERLHCLDEQLDCLPKLSDGGVMFCDDLGIILNNIGHCPRIGIALSEGMFEFEIAQG